MPGAAAAQRTPFAIRSSMSDSLFSHHEAAPGAAERGGRAAESARRRARQALFAGDGPMNLRWATEDPNPGEPGPGTAEALPGWWRAAANGEASAQGRSARRTRPRGGAMRQEVGREAVRRR